MKTTRGQQWWWTILMLICVLTVRGDNPCIEYGPHTNSLQCLSQGTLSPGYMLSPTDVIVGVGQPITPPTIAGLSVTNGLERYFVTYDCSSWMNAWHTNSPNYTFSLYFNPPIPSSISTPGIYTYAAKVVVTGSPCSPFTNTVGTMTVNVTNNATRLNYWPFDNTNTWISSNGQLPLVATNIAGVPSWDTNAVFIGSNNPAILSYAGSDTNISLDSGTVRFWFKPHWSSGAQGGTGPGGYGRLIELGSNNPVLNTNAWTVGSTNGWWSLFLSTNGNQIAFGTSTNSHGKVNLTAGIGWGSNLWHQVVLTYTSTNSLLYVDGQLAAGGDGSIYFPNASERVRGFRVGSDTTGNNQAQGTFDELETFNYPLSASDISSNYLSADRDNNGLPDGWELQHFGHIGIDPYGDPDGDGISNLQESRDGTDPNHFDPVRLGYWRFDDPPVWSDDEGLLPTNAYHVLSIPSWSGDAVKLLSQQGGVLSYPSYRTNGSSVMLCSNRTGSIRFWFKPEWSSQNFDYDGTSGNGPGDPVRLLEVGRQTSDADYGWFALTVNSFGTALNFETEANGIHTDNATYPLNINSNNWYQIVLIYTPTNSILYVNGMGSLSVGSGVTNLPSQTVIQQGLHLGCSWDGIHQANGNLDELETFNYPLSASEIISNYQAIISVDTDGDGLPDVEENALGTRLDAIDSDCDGLPDAWEVVNGLNPRDPSDATTAMLAAYANGSNVMSLNYNLLADLTNLVNIAFVTDASSPSNSAMQGAVIIGPGTSGTTNVWNYGDINSDYYTQGVSLQNAAGEATSMKLYAYLGPCINNYFDEPDGYDVEKYNMVDAASPNTTNYVNYIISTNYSLSRPYLFIGNSRKNLLDWSFLTDSTSDGSNIGYYDGVPCGGDQDSPNILIHRDIQWHLICAYYIDYFFGLPTHEATLNDYYATMNGAIEGSDSYAGLLGQYINASGAGLTNWGSYAMHVDGWPSYQWQELCQADGQFEPPLTGNLFTNQIVYTNCIYPPSGFAYCYIPAFANISSSEYKENGGALWQYSDMVNSQANDMNGDSEGNWSTPEGWFQHIYTQAKRTLLVSGLSSGQYRVYVYYNCPTEVDPAIFNGVTSVKITTPLGIKCWYCDVFTKTFLDPTNLTRCLTAPAPFWVMTNDVGHIQIDIAAPPVADTDDDVRILGLQVVKTADLATTAATIRVIPGKQVNYLSWDESDFATNYNVYRGVGTTNSWSLLVSTPSLKFTDNNLNVGTTYYYKVVGVGSNNVVQTESAVVSAVPFGCADPLPPVIDYVNPLQIPVANGTYPIDYQMLLTNSDAYDPQGYPLTFKVDSVVSGSLMINGSPFGTGNDTIGMADSVVWMPPSVMTTSNTPAFRIYVFDGANRSSKTADVEIKQHPKVYLYGLGNNEDGAIGNGFLLQPYVSDILPYDALDDQATQGVLPRDPRWEYYDTTDAIFWSLGLYVEASPQRVLDIDNIATLFPNESYCGTEAVTTDGRLWMWGADTALEYGLPLVWGANTETPTSPMDWEQINPDDYDCLMEYPLYVPSPMQIQQLNGSQILSTGVRSVCSDFESHIILKEDGTLWSWGTAFQTLGRDPQPTNDLFVDCYALKYGIIPGRIEIDGNNNSELVPGRKFVEVHCEPYESAAVARCQDGSVWWWGYFTGEVLPGSSDWYFYLAGNDGRPDWQPKRLTTLDIPGAAPIIQISLSGNHMVILRADGLVSEIGHIPSLDTNAVAGQSESYGSGTEEELASMYRAEPVAITGLPQNIRQICAAWTYDVALTDDGNVWIWGHMGDTNSVLPRQIKSLKDITKIAANYYCILALDKNGSVWGWGYNGCDFDRYTEFDSFFGIRGSGDFYSSAVRVQGIENATDIFCGISTAFVLGTEEQGKPVSLTAAPMNRSVTLSWSNYPAASSYIIYRSPSEDGGYVAVGTSTVNSYTDQNPPLQNGQTYYYQVSAVVNGVETLPSWDVAATPMPSPQPVQNLVAIDECHAITLVWNSPTNATQSPPEEYRVERAASANGDYLAIAHCQANTQSYEDDTVVAGQTYYYRVVPVNSAGEPSANVTVSGMIDSGSCALSPTISSNWNPNPGNGWFTISVTSQQSQEEPTATATLCWAGPPEGNWLYWSGDIATNIFVSGFLNEMTYYQNSSDSNLFTYLWSQCSNSSSNILADANATLAQKISATVDLLNHLITNGSSIYNPDIFQSWALRPATANLINETLTGTNLVKFNRMLLDDLLGYNSCGFITGPSWGTELDGFRVYYRYALPDGKSTGIFYRDVDLNSALTNTVEKQLGSDYGDDVTCYRYQWPIIYGAKYWVNVAAIVNGQVGNPSTEIGPLASSSDPYSWEAVLNAVPGYQQIYLDWPDDNAFLNYDIKCTALIPGSTSDPQSGDVSDFIYNRPEAWVVLATNLTDARYWYTGLTPTNFTPVDFKYVGDLANRLTNAIDTVSAILWNDFSSSARNDLINFGANSDVSDERICLASELTRIIQNGSLIFTTNQAGMADADLSSQTKALLERYHNGPALSPTELATLNRLLLEDAYVQDIARYETPSPVGFVSQDFNNNQINNDLIYSKFSNYGTFPPTDRIANKLWSLMSPAATNQIMHYDRGDTSATNILTMQRLLATELTRIIQTNYVLFSTNDVISYGRTVSSRAMELIERQNNLDTNEIYLLNRLLLQDAWDYYSENPYNDIEPLSDLRYYWVDARPCDSPYLQPSHWVGARPDDAAVAPAALSFSAQAFAYDSMALVQWNIPGATGQSPGSDTSWQFSVERREGSDGQYVNITQSSFGLAYMDSDVVNDHSYQYRVTAYDTNYNRYQAETSLVTPANSASLTLFDPQPGNGYVDLSWTPIRANQFTIMHATSPTGPFEAVATLNGQNAYESAQNTYRHIGIQNGVTHYYRVEALTPTGVEIDSEVKSATPLTSLATLPPDNFHGQFLPDDANGHILLSWTARSGAKTYQVFLRDQSRLTPLPGYNGLNTSCTYAVPDGTPVNSVFTFDVRSVNAQEIAGDLAETTVTNLQINSGTDTEQPVVLQVAGSLGPSVNVVGPTNLMLSAEVNVPSVQQVNFYANDQLIGTASSAPFQMTWYHVPGVTQEITAVAYVQSGGFYGGSPAQTFNSTSITLNVHVEPELSAYQTSATDLQIPAPALPISISRSYTSRSTDTNGILGIGWSAGWDVSSVKLSEPLSSSWEGVYQTSIGSWYSLRETAVHYATVALPNGSSVGFAPQLQVEYGGNSPGNAFPVSQAPYVDDDDLAGVLFVGFEANQGSLICSDSEMPFTDDYDSDSWNNQSIYFEPYTPSQFTYTAPDGTVYTFGQHSDNLTWKLTKTTDRSGNSLTYTYNEDNALQSISNSCGRAITFAYSNPQTGVTNISVSDAIGGAPVVVYVVSNNLLTEVHQLVNRTANIYQTNRYVYGSNAADSPTNFNRLIEVYDARGIRVLQNTYTNTTGDLAAQVTPGRTNTFQIDASYDLTVTTTTGTATNTAMVTSDASGSISGATQPVSGTTPSATTATQCDYDSQGNLISQTDANGNTKTYTYDDQNRLVGQSDANGGSTSVQLNQYGQPTISTDANGQQTLYEYDNAGNPVNVRDPSGTSTRYTYSSPVKDGGGNVLVGEMQTSQSQTAPFVPYTIVTTNVYDTDSGSPIKGDLLQTTEEWVDSSGHVVGAPVTTGYTYDANGNRLTETKTRAVTGGTQTIHTAYYYDALNRVTNTVVWADGAETLSPQTNTVTYNALGKQATSTDAAGRTTTNVYDFSGNLIETAYPDGTVSRTSYDAFGRQEYVQERAVPSGSATTAPATHNVYDASGRVIRVEKLAAITLTKTAAVAGTDYVGPAGQLKLVATAPGAVLTVTRTFYDAVGNVQYAVDARGAVTQYQYDAAGRRTNVIVYTQYSLPLNEEPSPSTLNSQLSTSTSYTYDASGNQTTVTDAAGHTTTSHYDAANRLVQVEEPSASGTVSRYTYYDGLGRKIQENDESGVATAYTYDFRGLLTSVTLAFGTTQSLTTVYQYDELGNEIKQTDANGHSTTFKYDALGRRTGRTLPGNQSEGYAYDIAGNLIYQTNFNSVVITNRYDLNNRLTNCSAPAYKTTYAYNVLGLRTNMTDASGVTAYFYNSLSQLTNKTVTWSGQSPITLNYRYDALGSLTNLWSSTANGVSNAYQFDLLGRITNVLANGSSVANYGFDAVGNLQTLRYGNGVTNLYQYDACNRLTNQVWKLNNTTLANFAYTLGVTGNRIGSSEIVNGTSRTYNWSYDYLYRLTSESIQNIGTVNYGFDAVGNRTNRQSTISQLPSANSSYTANDWLASDTYDNNGNTTVSGTTNYQYDVLNHLTNANSGAILITYDGDGNRVSKKVGGTTTYYLVDDRNPSGYAQVLEEYQGASLSRAYNYGLALISQRQVSGGIVSYYGTDGHGSTRFLLNTSGGITDTYTYDAYGVLIANTGSTPNSYLYCGQQWDSDLQMYSLRDRYYKPDYGRFWTMDSYYGSSQDPLSLHKYLYCYGNPINGFDPSGHDFELMSVMSAIGNGLNMTARVGAQAYLIYSKAAWLKNGIELAETTLASGTLDPTALALWASDLLPINKILGKIGSLPGAGAILQRASGAVSSLTRKMKEQLGVLASTVVARAKGYSPTSFRPRGNGGFDAIFKDAEGNFVIVESKFGKAPHLNPVTGSNPAQMSREWIRKNIYDLEKYDANMARELREALEADRPRIKGMVVTTKYDANGTILDPEFEEKLWADIGQDNW